MGKINCWEFKKCGREPGGPRASELGECPSATSRPVDGYHGGKNGGRCCWAVAGTLNGGKLQCTCAQQLPTCMACDFYVLVRAEEGSSIKKAAKVMHIMQTSAPEPAGIR